MEILPPFHETVHAEVQVFDNRDRNKAKPGPSGESDFNVKIAVLPKFDAIDEVVPCVVGKTGLKRPREFVRAVGVRVNRAKTLSPERGEVVKELSRHIPSTSLIGLAVKNDVCVVVDWNLSHQPTKVTLHYPCGNVITLENGKPRGENASPNAAIWRQYYDPDDLWSVYEGRIYEAYGRKVPAKTEDASLSDDVAAGFRADINTLADSIMERDERIKAQDDRITAQDKRIKALEDQLETLMDVLDRLTKTPSTPPVPVVQEAPENEGVVSVTAIMSRVPGWQGASA